MIRINIAPLSSNKAYRGRRFATRELLNFKSYIGYHLKNKIAYNSNLSLKITFGVSSKKIDLDNCLKSVIDAISERLGFNDNLIYEIHAKKTNVSKGKEYIEFELSTLKLDTE